MCGFVIVVWFRFDYASIKLMAKTMCIADELTTHSEYYYFSIITSVCDVQVATNSDALISPHK